MVLGENLFLNIQKKDLRISRDWDGDHWIDIEARPDILSVISAAISPDMETKVSMSSNAVMDAKVDGGTMQIEVIAAKTIPNVVEEEKPALAIQDCSDNLLEDTGKELQSSKDEKDGDSSESKKPPPSENDNNGNADDANIIHDKLNGMDGNDENNTNKGNDDREGELETVEQKCKTMELIEMKLECL